MDVVAAARAADEGARQHNVPGAGDLLQAVASVAPNLGRVLASHDRRSEPEVEAAREAWDHSNPGAVRSLWYGMTGGPDATPGQRFAILVGTIAIGAMTGGAGFEMAAGRGTDDVVPCLHT